MMRLAPVLLAVAIAASAPASAQTVAPEPPAMGALEIHPVYMDKTQTAFVDKPTLIRSGDLVEGWGYNVYLKPTEVAGHTTEAHWTRFQMSCARKSVTVTWVIGRKLFETTFKARIDSSFPVQDGTGWDQTYAYICDKVPIFKQGGYTNEGIATSQAWNEMSRKQ